MNRHGSTPRGCALWSEKDNALFAKLYPDYAALRKGFPTRTYKALRMHACASGLSKKGHRWTYPELSRLRKVYCNGSMSELRAAFPLLKPSQIKTKAMSLGMKRPRRLKKLGEPLLDALREKALASNLSMRDLDAYANAEDYFRKSKWQHGKRIQDHPCYRAILALGGRVEAHFD